MTLVIGTDEAGYGPNLGPLTVAATAWRVDAAPAAAGRVLAAAVGAGVRPDARGVLWDDSKRVHRDTGPAAVEPGALVAVALAAGRCPRSWVELAAAVDGLDPAAPGELAALDLPRASDAPAVAAAAERTRRGLAAHGVELAAVRCRAIHPAEFNRRLAGGGNKADLLSATTLDLAAGLAAGSGGRPTLVWCDRHGGRKRYAGVVARHFESPIVRVVAETAELSAYELDGRDCRLEFAVGGESRLPVAVASMVAKYVRELAMLAFNDGWCRRVPGLRPTAGYPLDARRWRREVEATPAAGPVDWEAVWRRA